MIRTITVHHLSQLSQDIALRRARVAYLLVLVAFSLWGFGEWLATADTASEAVGKVLCRRVWIGLVVTLTFLTAWLVMRHTYASYHDRGITIIAQAGLSPWQAVLGNLTALHVYLVQLLFLSLPVMIYMYQFGAISMPELGNSYVALLMWFVLVLLIAFSWRMCVDNVLVAVIMTSITIPIFGVSYWLLIQTIGAIPGTLILMVADAVMTLVVLWVCHVKLFYLSR